MSAAVPQRALLLPHPDASGDAVWNVAVTVELKAPATLVCHYTVSGDMTRVRIPAVGAGHRTDGLWKHTCFEAFVAPGELPEYHEFNFSPSLDWAIYRFSAYREDMRPAAISLAPQISQHRSADGVELRASVRLESLESLRRASRLRVLGRFGPHGCGCWTGG